MVSGSQHMRAATEVAKKHGFFLYRQRRHMIWRNAAGAQVVCARTPSCHHALRNFECSLRRANASQNQR